MRRKRFSVLVLHSENDYFYQQRLLTHSLEVDLRDIKEKKLMASPSSLKTIEQRLPFSDNCITFFGKGDYHYLSILFLKNIKKEFNLIVFDNHIDDRETLDKGFVSCGSWLNEAVKLPRLKKILIITSDANLKKSKNGKIEIIDCNIDTIQDRLNNLPLYVSIDKDVLHESYLKTTWDQGKLSPNDIINVLKFLKKEKEIIGADICGEPDEFNFSEHKKSEELNLALIATITEEFRERKKAS